MLAVKVEQFEGPLDILLQLIEEEKLDITTMSLASVTDQYLTRLASIADHLRASELADFLVIAAKLIYIKSKLLLPYLTQEDEQEIEELTQQLKIYQEFHRASKVLQRLLGEHHTTFSRPFSFDREQVMFLPPKKLTAPMIREVFANLLMREEKTPEPPRMTISFDSGISLQERISFLKDLAMSKRALSFLQILRDAKSKTEIIVNFLAILELVKQRFLTVSQESLFEDIVLERKM